MRTRMTVQIVCANVATNRQYIAELQRGGDRYRLLCDSSASAALANAAIARPAVVLLDDSVIIDEAAAVSAQPRDSSPQTRSEKAEQPEKLESAAVAKLEPIVAPLTEVAPVVIVAAAGWEPELRF